MAIRTKDIMDADANSDHNPEFIIQLQLSLKRIQKPKQAARFDLHSLNNSEIRDIFKAVVVNKPEEKEDVKSHWRALLTTIWRV